MLDLNKGDKVILKGFTGIKLGVFEIKSTTKKTLTIIKANGDELVFDKKTGKQINVEEGKEKYANSIIEDDGSFVPPTRKKTEKKSTKAAPAKKSNKQPEPEEDEDEEDDEDDEEEEEKPAPKKSKKSAKKSKKSSDEDEDEDDFEEV